MKIGIDFDGTLADIDWAKQQYALRNWGIELSPDDLVRDAGLSLLGEDRYLEMVMAAHITDLTLEMPPIPGALEAARRLAERHDLVLVTARLDEEMELARTWLERHGVPIGHAVHTRRESKRAAWELNGIDVHIDDMPLVLWDHPDRMVPALLRSPHNHRSDRCEKTRLVEHWEAFEALVGALEEERLALPLRHAYLNRVRNAKKAHAQRVCDPGRRGVDRIRNPRDDRIKPATGRP